MTSQESFLRRTLVSTAAITAAVLCAHSFAEADQATSDSTEQTQEYIPKKADITPDSCTPPSRAAVTAVRKLLAQPADPDFQSPRSDYANTTDADIQAKKAVIAAKDGVLIVDTTPFIQRIYQLESDQMTAHKPALPYTTYLQIADQAVKPFGFDIELAQSGDSDAVSGSETPSAASLTENAKGMGLLTNILSAYDDLPVSLVQGSNLKHIDLYTHPGDTPYAAFATTGKDGDKDIQADIDRASSPDIYRHELGHHIDAESCPDIFNDPYFAALDGSDDVYSGELDDERNYNFVTFQSRTSNDYAAIENNDIDSYCAAKQLSDVAGAQVVAYSGYHPNVGEEKAEVESQLLNPQTYGNMISPDVPAMQRESTFLLARMYQINPNATRYLIEISTRKTSDKPIVDCQDK